MFGSWTGFRWVTIVKKRTSDLRYEAFVDESFPQVSHSSMHGNGDIFRCSKILSFIIYSELNKDHSTALKIEKRTTIYLKIAIIEKKSLLAQSVERVDCRAGGRGFDSRGRTNTQGLKVTEK